MTLALPTSKLCPTGILFVQVLSLAQLSGPRDSALMSFLLFHLLCTVFMTGLIWLVQVVHYPAFHFIPESDAVRFAVFHTTRITWVVAPVMIVEGLTLAVLLFQRDISLAFKIGAACLLLVIWVSTATLQVPQHSILALGKDVSAIDRLVSTNWLRTIAWTLKSGLVSWELCRLFNLKN